MTRRPRITLPSTGGDWRARAAQTGDSQSGSRMVVPGTSASPTTIFSLRYVIRAKRFCVLPTKPQLEAPLAVVTQMTRYQSNSYTNEARSESSASKITALAGGISPPEGDQVELLSYPDQCDGYFDVIMRLRRRPTRAHSRNRPGAR